MNQKIDIIHTSLPLLQWAVDALSRAPAPPDGAQELLAGLGELLEEPGTALMIEPGPAEESGLPGRKICCGGLTIYAAARRVERDGQEISLTPKEFDILYFLARNRGEVFTKEQIYQAVWDEEYLLDDSNIMAFIRKIRKKIEPNPDAPQYILTIWGIGYKFNDRM